MVPKSYSRRLEYSCSDVPVVDPYSIQSLRQLSKPRWRVTVFTTSNTSFLHTMARLMWSALSVSLRSGTASPNSTTALAASSNLPRRTGNQTSYETPTQSASIHGCLQRTQKACQTTWDPLSSADHRLPLLDYRCHLSLFKTFKSSVSCDISNGERHLGQSCGFEQCCTEHRVEAVFPGRVGLHGYAGDPTLWIHAWRHLTAASEEEHKVNVDGPKRACTANTLFTPTLHGTVPETTATCEDGMAPEDDHPEVGLLHDGETEEAESSQQPPLHLRQQPPQRSSQHLSGALRSYSSTARAPAAVSSRNGRLQLTRETACTIFQLFTSQSMLGRNCLMFHVWRLIQSPRFTGFRGGGIFLQHLSANKQTLFAVVSDHLFFSRWSRLQSRCCLFV